jgi:hypothetical protein
MATYTTHSKLLHEPLPTTTSHFRLLEILQGDDRIVCELTVWPIADAPSYCALSYTWGDQASTESITINGKVSVVRTNCAYVLRQAFASRSSKYYWIDAICIDQTSTQEKNHQVAMMGQLYKRAAHVSACVGPHAGDSEFLFQTMDKYRSLLKNINAHVSDSGSNSSGSWSVVNPVPQTRWLALKCFFAMKASTRRRLAYAYIEFMTRPYFSRVWILQELYLATEISCCCGMDSRPFDNLMAISLLMDFWINERTHSIQWWSLTRCFVYLLSKRTWLLRQQNSGQQLGEQWDSIEPQRGCQALASGAWGPRRLAEVLDAMKHFECADVRDKLYGILYLVDWRGTSIPTPDYGKGHFEVAVEVLQRYLDERACAPSSDNVVDWARQLCQVFDISLKEKALGQALKARYPRSVIPAALTHDSEPLKVDKQSAMMSSQSTGWRKPHRALDMDNVWYGMRLRLASTSKRNPPPTETKHLYYAAPSATERLGRILNKDGYLFAYAPANTQVNDWLLFSTKGSMHDPSPLSLIIRRLESNKYTIVGQACIWNQTTRKISPGHSLKYFQISWGSEDALFLYWSYIRRRSSLQTEETLADWLDMHVCGSEGSSVAHNIEAPKKPHRSLRANLISSSRAISTTSGFLEGEDSDSESAEVVFEFGTGEQ